MEKQKTQQQLLQKNQSNDNSMQLIECLKSNLSIFEYKENIQKNWITTTGSPNFAKIYNSGLPIKSVVEQDGLVNTYKIVNLMLNRFLQYFNLAIKMSEDQVAEYACQIVDSSIIDGYTLEDFAVFFEKAKTGIYGVPKVAIDGAFINTMLDKYNLERQKSINEYRAKIEHNQKLGIYDDTTPQRRYNPQTQEFDLLRTRCVLSAHILRASSFALCCVEYSPSFFGLPAVCIYQSTLNFHA